MIDAVDLAVPRCKGEEGFRSRLYIDTQNRKTDVRINLYERGRMAQIVGVPKLRSFFLWSDSIRDPATWHTLGSNTDWNNALYQRETCRQNGYVAARWQNFLCQDSPSYSISIQRAPPSRHRLLPLGRQSRQQRNRKSALGYDEGESARFCQARHEAKASCPLVWNGAETHRW